MQFSPKMAFFGSESNHSCWWTALVMMLMVIVCGYILNGSQVRYQGCPTTHWATWTTYCCTATAVVPTDPSATAPCSRARVKRRRSARPRAAAPLAPVRRRGDASPPPPRCRWRRPVNPRPPRAAPSCTILTPSPSIPVRRRAPATICPTLWCPDRLAWTLVSVDDEGLVFFCSVVIKGLPPPPFGFRCGAGAAKCSSIDVMRSDVLHVSLPIPPSPSFLSPFLSLSLVWLLCCRAVVCCCRFRSGPLQPPKLRCLFFLFFFNPTTKC